MQEEVHAASHSEEAGPKARCLPFACFSSLFGYLTAVLLFYN